MRAAPIFLHTVAALGVVFALQALTSAPALADPLTGCLDKGTLKDLAEGGAPLKPCGTKSPEVTWDAEVTWDPPRHACLVFVEPVSDDPGASGTVLLDALAGITTASASNPCLLKIYPGIYDLGASTLAMKSFVDIEGSGQSVTTIKANERVIETASNVEMRHLTVTNSVGDSAIEISGDDSVVLTDLTVSASALGVRSQKGSSSITLSNMTVDVSGANWFNQAVVIGDTSAARLEHVSMSGSGGTNGAQGLLVSNAADVTARDIRIEVSGGNNSIGILNNGASLVLRDSNVVASAGGSFTVGLRLFNGQVPWFVMDVMNTELTAEPGGNSYGIFNDSGFTSNAVLINRSSVTGDDYAISASDPFENGVFHIGASQLVGGVIGNTFKCVGAYDGDYEPLDASCL
jgi:hypothetical protein